MMSISNVIVGDAYILLYVPKQAHQQQRPLESEAFGGPCPWQRIHRWGRACTLNISREWPAAISQGPELLRADAYGIFTYSEKLYVVKDLVIEREVIARDDVDAGLFLYLPVLLSETLSFSEKVFLG